MKFTVLLALVYAAISASHVTVWRSELALWSHAAQIAPMKPRPVLNFGRAALLEGRVDLAEQAFYRTLALAERTDIPTYDRADAVTAATANLQTVEIMRAVSLIP